MKIQALIVDPQNDFCVPDDGHGNKGALVVPGATDDMSRLAHLIYRLGGDIDGIHVTMDSHQTIGIERPSWWCRVSDMSEPAPFTRLGVHPDNERIVAYKNGLPTEEEYRAVSPIFNQGRGTHDSVSYLRDLAARGQPHIVWPEHCVIGTWGWNLVPEISAALRWWEHTFFKRVNYIFKGNNPWTEHFSAIQAEVPDPNDPSTLCNTALVRCLENADRILLAGEALSHCVAATGRDLCSAFSDPKHIKKMRLLRDCTTSVQGFESLGEAFVGEMEARGMRVMRSNQNVAS